MKKTFEEFTNLYEVQKTLRFELKPVGNTQKMLDEDSVFEKDKVIKEKYQNTKPFIDRLHREFVEEALEGILLTNLKKYFNALKNWKNNKKDKEAQKSLKTEEERLRKEIVGFFNKTAKDWAEKKYADLDLNNNDVGILFEEGIFDVLKNRYGNEDKSFLTDDVGSFLKNDNGEKISIFNEWKGFIGYFTKFQQTRKNFYVSDGTETAIATRIIDQNLRRFCDNLKDFKEIKNRIVDFSEVEKNFNKSICDIFSLDFYNQCLLQNGINIYNEILGGKTTDNGKKLRGINEIVNEYRQKNKGDKLPFLKSLDKQIASEKEKFVVGIGSDEELFETLKIFYKTAEEKTKILKTLFSDFASHDEKYDLSKIYISKVMLNTIVHTGKWIIEAHKFEELLYGAMRKYKPTGLNYDKKEDSYKFPDFIALSYLKSGLEKFVDSEKIWKEKYYKNEENKKDRGFLTGKELVFEQFLRIFDYEFNSLFESEITDEKGKIVKTGYNIFKKDFENLINQKSFSVKPESKIVIKNFSDNVLWIYQMAKYFAVEKKRNWNDEYELDDFYTNPDFGYKKFYENAYEEIVKVYNNLRNYLTKKPYNEEKWKLNFENAGLLSGWPDSPDGNTQYCSFIFREGQKYFLGITDFPKLFDRERFFEAYEENSNFEKMVYKQVDAKTLYGSVYIGLFGTKYSEDQKKIKDNELIQRMKKVLETRVKSFPEFQKFIEKIDNKKYEDAKSLAREISNGSFYNISFVPISEAYLKKGVHDIIKNKKGEKNQKKLYVFEIYNQDFAKGKTGNKNLHTLYFENIFSDENISKNFPIKLNGNAELFFRPKSIKAEKVKRRFLREIIDKKRYTEDKIFFHCPITLNRSKEKITEKNKSHHSKKFNIGINNFLADNKDINIIGIDRGEKHLAYYSVIDQSGKKIESGSLNTVKGIEYASKLEKKANEREFARRDWQTVEGIKDMKKGYISQIVRELADLAIKHNAIIVLEDLNMRFKQIRGGIEKSIYQQLEKALIDKLSFLVNKGERDSEKAGHLLKAYQLCAPFESFKDMGKQTGILFYTQSSYTSKTCPQCGFRKNNNKFYFEGNIEKAKDVLRKLKSFEYDIKKQCFNLKYCLSDFASKEEIERSKKQKRDNILYFGTERKSEFNLTTKDAVRYRWHDKNTERGKNFAVGESEYIEKVTERERSTKKGVVKKYDITRCLIGLFESDAAKNNNLNYKKDLLETLITGKFNSDFYKKLFIYLNFLFEIRNSVSGTEIDYISCPECGFHSNKSNYIKNGDDNGAFNIARKGIMILEKITQYKNKNKSLDKMGWGDLFIDIEEWDKFSQIINVRKKS